MLTGRSHTLWLHIWVILWVGVVSKRVKLVDHGYEGVTIAISDDITENERLLQQLEEVLTAASEVLFRATHNHVYFREFIIVVPNKWRTSDKYGKPLDSDLDVNQISIQNSHTIHGDVPYAKMYGECGAGGRSMHLTPNYILGEDNIHDRTGPPGKTIVHEWAHFRWGIFDEYPVDPKVDNEFYRDGKFYQPTRCSTEVEGALLNKYDATVPCSFFGPAGKPDDDCVFIPKISSNKAVGSLMYKQYIDTVVEFCDNPETAPPHLKHNRLALNRQNRICKSQSAWEVMRKHQDFKDFGKNDPLPNTTDTSPRFRYVRVQQRKWVLVLDTSGSMDGQPMELLKQAATIYIDTYVQKGSLVGIITFNSQATLMAPIRPVNTEEDRDQLIKALPTVANGGTSIGAGLKKAIEAFEQHTESSAGSIILITDGEEHNEPYISDIKPDLKKKGIVVHVSAFTQKADHKLESLARETGGQTFFFSGQADSTGLLDGLAAVATEGSGLSTDGAQKILTEARVITKHDPLVGTFYIDSTIGTETSVTISYGGRVKVHLQGPLTNYSAVGNTTIATEVIKILIPEKAEVGTWSYNISTDVEHDNHVVLSIQSKTRIQGMDVLQVTSWIPQKEDIDFHPKVKVGLYAEVLKGTAPVLNANVVATIERPNEDPIELVLQDTGAGSDIIKDDGVYTTSVMARDMSGNGRYSIKIKVVGREEEVKFVVKGEQSDSRANEITPAGHPIDIQTASGENFQRTVTAGAVVVKNYFTTGMLDEMAPSRITDFRVVSFDLDSLKAALQWSAVGDDMERGTAAEYQMYTSEDFDQLLFRTEQANKISLTSVVKGNLSNPLSPGSLEDMELMFSPIADNTTIFLGVMAVDKMGNRGDISNLVSLSMARELSVPHVKAVKVNKSSSRNYIEIILPLVLILFALIVGILLYIYFSRKRRSLDLHQVPKHLTEPLKTPVNKHEGEECV